jgi:hypothetical protein
MSENRSPHITCFDWVSNAYAKFVPYYFAGNRGVCNILILEEKYGLRTPGRAF